MFVSGLEVAVTTSDTLGHPLALAEEAAGEISRMNNGYFHHEIAIILGSGWNGVADMLGQTIGEARTSDLPGFYPSTVKGHTGRISTVVNGRIRLLVFLGRTHLYEGHGVEAVVHRVHVAAAMGCQLIILTNGCGSMVEGWQPGTPVLINDHINRTGVSPLPPAFFLDQTEVYSARLRALCRQIDPTLNEGVYIQLPGPEYETPAEIRMLRRDAQLVGMSTVLEAIAARAAGMEVLALSLVTNLAAGISPTPLSHEEVLAAGQAAASRLGALLAEVIKRLQL